MADFHIFNLKVAVPDTLTLPSFFGRANEHVGQAFKLKLLRAGWSVFWRFSFKVFADFDDKQ